MRFKLYIIAFFTIVCIISNASQKHENIIGEKDNIFAKIYGNEAQIYNYEFVIFLNATTKENIEELTIYEKLIVSAILNYWPFYMSQYLNLEKDTQEMKFYKKILEKFKPLPYEFRLKIDELKSIIDNPKVKMSDFIYCFALIATPRVSNKKDKQFLLEEYCKSSSIIVKNHILMFHLLNIKDKFFIDNFQLIKSNASDNDLKNLKIIEQKIEKFKKVPANRNG